MLFHLVKKDFLIVKKYVLIMLVAAIAQRVSMPQSVRPAVLRSIPPEASCSVKIHFLYAYLCDLLPDFRN